MPLAPEADADLDLSTEAGDALDVLRRLQRRPERRRRRRVEQERRRHPVDLAGVELERVDPDFCPEEFKPTLKKLSSWWHGTEVALLLLTQLSQV